MAMIVKVTCPLFHMLLTNIILSAVCWTERRQTMLFSATTTQKTEALTRLALKKEPFYVGVDDETDKATVEGLEQGL
jgi:superfamily II DNA/RNA helicase